MTSIVKQLQELGLIQRAEIASLRARAEAAEALVAEYRATYTASTLAEARLAAVIALCDGIEWALGTIRPETVRAAATGLAWPIFEKMD